MPFELKTEQGIAVAVLSGTLDKLRGEEFASEIESKLPKGAPLIADGSGLETLTHQGVLSLIKVQRWVSVPERRRLLLVGFNATIWRAIVESGSDFFFESKSSLAEALGSLGASSSSAPAPRPAPPAEPAVSPAQRASIPAPREQPVAETWLQPLAAVPPPAPAPPPVVAAAPPAYSAPIQFSPFVPVRPKPSRKPWVWWSVAAAVLALGGVACWWLFGSHLPVLTLSAPSTVVEEDGKEADEITVQVRHGQLVERSWDDLPKGLYFDPPAEDTDPRTYTLRGKASPGATTSTVHLEATNAGGQRCAPVAFTVNVREKPMTWELNTLQSLSLKVGKRVWETSKFLVNADRVAAGNGLPPGLTVERVPGKNKDWQLAGTPTTAGEYPVVFEATSPAGKREQQTCTLRVAAGAPPPPPPTPEPAASNNPPAPTPTPAPPVVEAVSNVDDGMRRFLLERIENLPARYTDKDRENLRAVVGTLQEARLIYRVVFERDGQTELSPDQSGKLKDALLSPDNAALLKDANCQIVVVGYASRTGSMAGNVRISKLRAWSVNVLLKSVLGRNADLCGDYGPTDVVDQAADATNRAVEVYAGILKPTADMQANAEQFKQDFNRRHGLH